ncbi:hypothetical protein Btru_045278 [Bulinus truncatus]|nr:hypothetical protein Btru_045278 [Bulinus truncatus]
MVGLLSQLDLIDPNDLPPQIMIMVGLLSQLDLIDPNDLPPQIMVGLLSQWDLIDPNDLPPQIKVGLLSQLDLIDPNDLPPHIMVGLLSQLDLIDPNDLPPQIMVGLLSQLDLIDLNDLPPQIMIMVGLLSQLDLIDPNDLPPQIMVGLLSQLDLIDPNDLPPQIMVGCGGEYHDRSGVINSPNFPSAYPDDSRCSWKITADANEVIALRFEHVDLAVSERENCPDSVTVYDGDTDLSPVIVRFCEYKTPEELSSIIIRSRGNQLLVKFSTDKVNHNSGFDAFYWSLACEPFKYGNESCDKPCNCVQSNTRFCHSVNGTCVCKTGWNSADCSADVNECTQSRVELCSDYQQCTNTKGSYNCECKPGMVKNSTGHCEDCPLLSYGDSCRFQCNCVANNTERCDPDTGGCICKAGWRAGDCSLDINECQLANAVCEPTKICVNTIGSFHCEACRYVLNGSSGVITSLNYPNAAPPSSECTWLISVSNPNATISLRFSKIELYDGTLTIYDGVSQGSPLIGSYRLDYDVLIRSTGNNIFILAFNSRWPSGQGFNGTYEANGPAYDLINKTYIGPAYDLINKTYIGPAYDLINKTYIGPAYDLINKTYIGPAYDLINKTYIVPAYDLINTTYRGLAYDLINTTYRGFAYDLINTTYRGLAYDLINTTYRGFAYDLINKTYIVPAYDLINKTYIDPAYDLINKTLHSPCL